MGWSRSYIFLLPCLLIFNTLLANKDLGFVSPVEHEIRLTGNFMEIRTNHFHTGIDIKSSKGRSGDNILSVHDGFISRIKIQSGSYGQALYIDHPNGFTSVYAHLDTYVPEIKSYLESIQYAIESYEVDVYLPDSLIMIQKGQLIGTMGNTGRSYGPHLHFELRETDTENPVNPELYGIGPDDNKAPVLESLHVYSMTDNMISSSKVKYFKSTKDHYALHTPMLDIDSEGVAFGIQGYDQMNGSSNKNGIYSLSMFVDDTLYYNWKAEQYSFEEIKKINGFIDYERQRKFGQKVYNLYSPYCNELNSIRSTEKGIIKLESQAQNVLIVAEDLFGNVSELAFMVRGGGKEKTFKKTMAVCDTTIYLQEGMFNFEFPEKSFFDPSNLNISYDTVVIDGQKSHSVNIGSIYRPVGRYFKISTPIPNNYSDAWTFLGKNKSGRWVSFGADTLNGKMFGFIDQLGTFAVYEDKKTPTLEILTFDKALKNKWKFKVYDNVMPDGREPELQYRATVDGEWICMVYDLKTKTLSFDDFKKINNNSQNLEILLKDGQGNAKSYHFSLR